MPPRLLLHVHSFVHLKYLPGKGVDETEYVIDAHVHVVRFILYICPLNKRENSRGRWIVSHGENIPGSSSLASV